MDAQVFVEIEYSQKFSVPPPDVVIDTVCITPVLSLACTSRSEIIKSSPPSCEIVIITEVGLVFAAVTVSLADGGAPLPPNPLTSIATTAANATVMATNRIVPTTGDTPFCSIFPPLIKCDLSH